VLKRLLREQLVSRVTLKTRHAQMRSAARELCMIPIMSFDRQFRYGVPSFPARRPKDGHKKLQKKEDEFDFCKFRS
jgi:hypothetical protein